MIPSSARPQDVKATTPKPLSAGTYIQGLLKNDLSTRKSKVGDRVELEVVGDVNVFDGFRAQLVVPRHSRLFGTVTMVRAASKDQPAVLAIHMVEARTKSGTAAFDGILGRDVLVIHDLAAFAKGANTPNTAMTPENPVRNDKGMLPLEGVAVIGDATFGSVLSSKHNFTLVKNEAQLSIVTR